MGVLRIMSHEGDTAVTWDPTKTDEVAVATKTFDDARLKGFAGYRTIAVAERQATGTRASAELVRTFDPKADEIIMRTPMVGG